MKPLQNWFRRRRKHLDLSMREIGERCGVTVGCVQNWEWNLSAPRANQAAELAQAYEVDLSTIANEIVKLAMRVRHLGLRHKKRGVA